jgi:hypothetical protein
VLFIFRWTCAKKSSIVAIVVPRSLSSASEAIVTKRRVLWTFIGLFTIVFLFLLVPGSPFFWPQVLDDRGHHNGHFTNYWIDQLDDPDLEKRLEAIRSLGAIGGSKAKKAIPRLADLMVNDPDLQTRVEASLALTKMDKTTKDVIPQITQAMKDPDLVIRANALRILIRLRTDAHPALSALIEAVNDDTNKSNLGIFTFTLQELAVTAVGYATAGTTDGVATLRPLLTPSHSQSLRIATINALILIGPAASSSVADLEPLLKDNDAKIKTAAKEAIELITGKPIAALPAPSTVAKNEPKLELPEEDRVYIWDLEHHGNVLVKHGFGPFAKALKEMDASALKRLCTDDFLGGMLNEPKRVQYSTAFAQVERQVDSGAAPMSLPADGFIAWLLAFRKDFGIPPQVKCTLMTLSPEQRGQLTGKWTGMGQLRLHGEMKKEAPAEVVVTFRYTIDQPTEENLDKGTWWRSAQIVQVQRGQATHALFKEGAEQRGLKTKPLHDNWTSEPFIAAPGGIYVCDFNKDGRLDLLVTDVNGAALYQGKAEGKFDEVTNALGLPRAIAHFPMTAWVDIDGDGWDDLVYGGRLFRNESGQKFVDVTLKCNIRLPHDGNGLVIADYDRDGQLDLYISRVGPPGSNSWLEGSSGDGRGNILLRNKGQWQFEDVTKASGTSGGRRSTFTAAWLDANNDGWPDLHVPNEFGNGVLLINKKDGTFTEQLLANELIDFGTMGATVGDINNDGNIDIYCANMYSKAGTRVIGNMRPESYSPEVMSKLRRFVAGSQLHLNRGGLKFDHVGKEMQVAAVGWAYGASLADLDNDGWLDLYATAGYVSRDRNKPDG